MYAYKAERWLMCPHTIITFSVNEYLSLTGFMSFTPLLPRHLIKSTIEITALKTTYRSTITASSDIDCFIIQLSILTASEKSAETNWCTRRVATMMTIITSTVFDPTNKRNRIPFPQVNGALSSVGEHSIYYAILSVNRQYRESMV